MTIIIYYVIIIIIIIIIIGLFSSPTPVDPLFKKQFRKRFVDIFHLRFISFLFSLV